MRNVAGHMVMLLMNVAVEDRDIWKRHETLDHGHSIASRPVPLRIEIEQRTMRQRHDGRLAFQLLEVCLQPFELRFADDRLRIGDVVKGDEMHALVIEGVVKISKEFLVGFTTVKRSVSRHKPHSLDPQLADNFAELSHPFAPLFGIIRGMRQVAGEDYEIRLFVEAVDRGDRLLQSTLRIRVDLGPSKPQ